MVCIRALCGPLRPLLHGLFSGAEEHDGLLPRVGAKSVVDIMEFMLNLFCFCESTVSGNLSLLSLSIWGIYWFNPEIPRLWSGPVSPVGQLHFPGDKELYEGHSMSAKPSLKYYAHFICVYQNHLKALLKLPFLGPIPRVSDWVQLNVLK